MSCGGTTKARKPTEEDISTLKKIIPQIEEKLGKALHTFDIVSLKTQVVAGLNYFAKVHLGDNKFIHIRVYQPLPGQGELVLHGLQEKDADDELEYFEQS